MANGNGIGNGYWITKTLVVALWGVVVTVVLFLGNVVKANDTKATREHTDIRKEIVEGDEKIKENVENKIEKIQTSQQIMLVQQTRILTILERIDNDD